MRFTIILVLLGVALSPFAFFKSNGEITSDLASEQAVVEQPPVGVQQPLALVPAKAGPALVIRQQPGAMVFMPSRYKGKVLALTPKSMIIQLCGRIGIKRFETLDDGTTVEIIPPYIQNNNQPPKEFVFMDDLLYISGLNPGYRGPLNGSYPYKVSDLSVGDVVKVEDCQHLFGIDFCQEVVIERRPGGKVPPSINDKRWPLDAPYRHDNCMNVEQAREEFAMQMLQFTWVVIHNQASDKHNAREAAPMPREAAPRP